MSQYTAVLTSRYYKELTASKGAMELAVPKLLSVAGDQADELLKVAAGLVLQLPAFDWTIEVDVFGTHRITVHFKGGSIDVDE